MALPAAAAGAAAGVLRATWGAGVAAAGAVGAGFWGGVVASLTTLEFDSLSRIGLVDAPIFMLHGDADDTVPVQLGRRLRDAAPPGVRWVEFPGGSHSRLHSLNPELYRSTMQQVMNTLTPPTAAPPAAHRRWRTVAPS